MELSIDNVLSQYMNSNLPSSSKFLQNSVTEMQISLNDQFPFLPLFEYKLKPKEYFVITRFEVLHHFQKGS